MERAKFAGVYTHDGAGTIVVRYSWEQRKLGDYIVEYHEVTTENNQYPALTSSRKGLFLQTEYFAGNQIASDDNTGYNVVPYGYFTYRHMSDDEIFHFNINDIVENGIVSTLYPVFITTDKLDSRYLQYQLNHGHEFARFAVLQKQGGSRTYMYLSKLKQLSLTMPKSVDEQKQISEFFMQLDTLITLHQRKLEQRLFFGCRFFIQGHTLTWCPATKEQGIAGSEAPRSTGRIRFCSKDVVPVDERTRHWGERSTTSNPPKPHLVSKAWCPATKNKILQTTLSRY